MNIIIFVLSNYSTLIHYYKDTESPLLLQILVANTPTLIIHIQVNPFYAS